MARSLTLDFDADVVRERRDPAPAGAGPSPAVDEAHEYSFEEKVLYALFALGIVANVLLQKFAWPLKGGGFTPIVLPLFVGAIALTPVLVKPRFDPVRVGGFFLLFVVAAFSTFFLAPRYSASSLMLFAALYVAYIVDFETSAANYRRCMKLFIAVMLGFVGVTLAQHIIQLVLSFRYWPDLNLLIDRQWLVPDYNYIQPIMYGSKYMKPNGVVFLEVSLLSQYIAVALAIELALFRRPVQMIVLSAGLLLTLAGTGALMIVLTLPVLLGRMRIRNAVIVIALLLVVCLIAFRVGWFDIVSARMDEYKHNGSSANLRFILPFERMLEVLHEPRALISGIGAGQIEKGRGFIWWPFTKVAIEYGLVSALIFYAFLIYTLFRKAPDKALAFVLLVWFSFEGTLLTAHNVLSLVLFGTLLRVAPEGRRARRLARPAAEPAGEFTADTRGNDPDRPTEARSRRSAPTPPESVAQLLGDITGEPLLDVLGTPATDGRLVYAIGDLHGRTDLFDRMLEAIATDADARAGSYDGKPLIVLLGDYVDRGPASAQLIDRILQLENEPAIELQSVLGNHEDAMLAFLDGRSSGISWGRHGGRTTVTSYGVPAPAQDTAEAWSATRELFVAAVPEAHVAYLRRLKHHVVVGGLIFVHAGLRAGVPLEKQRMKDILYIREEFLSEPVDSPLLIVHGHTPGDEAYGTRGRICVDTGAYATGLLTAVRFDGGRPALVTARAR